MGDAIGGFLPYAVGVAVSPIPIAGVLLMLVSKRARTNGPMFLLGWLVGLAVVGVVVLLIPGLQAGGGEPSTATGIVKGVLGILLLLVGIRAWRSRPADGDEAKMPGWMEKIDGMSSPTALGMGFLLSALNPKNLLLAVGGAATITASGLTTSQEYIALTVFVAIASLTILVPVVGYLIMGERGERVMMSAKDWLIQNNQTVMSVLLLVVSVALIGDAIEILF
jgi:Sap, sulfolipid-1-addressing protein